MLQWLRYAHVYTYIYIYIFIYLYIYVCAYICVRGMNLPQRRLAFLLRNLRLTLNLSIYIYACVCFDILHESRYACACYAITTHNSSHCLHTFTYSPFRLRTSIASLPYHGSPTARALLSCVLPTFMHTHSHTLSHTHSLNIAYNPSTFISARYLLSPYHVHFY